MKKTPSSKPKAQAQEGDKRLGNQFWKLRSKHGRDKLFATPELLWEAAVEYFEHTDSRKWIKKDWVGKDATEVYRENETPYTMSGLCLYLDASRQYLDEFERQCKAKDDELSQGFLVVLTRIREIVFTQKIEGASVGAFNMHIVSRELGLVDKREIEQDTTVKLDYDSMPDDMLENISKFIKPKGDD